MPFIPIQEIEEARKRISPYIRETPFIPFDYLSKRFGKKVFLKCESLQKTGSFKPRGAANYILQNLERAREFGVVTASAGNHAQGVAMISHLLGIQSTIVMPVNTPPIKAQNTQNWGAKIVLDGQIFDEAYERAKKLAKDHHYIFVHAFCDEKVIAGQGTIGLELLDHSDFSDIEAVVIPVGGGGLASGIGSVLRQKLPKIKIYGVTPKNAPAVLKSFQANQVVEEGVKYTLAEGTAFKKPETMMLGYLHDCLDGILSLSEESIATAISLLAEHAKLVVEGSGALGIAAILEEKIPEEKIAVLVCGGNIDLPTLSHLVQRGLVEQGRMIRLVVTIQDRPGGLHAVTSILAKEGANILQVFHQRATMQIGIGETEIDIDLETKGKDHTAQIVSSLREAGFTVHCM